MLVILATSVACSATSDPAPQDRLDFIDPFIGTGGGGFAQPQAFVGATVPFGMVKPGPDTSGPLLANAGFAHASGYWYPDDEIDGFSQLHLHGTGIEDYGNVLFMPSDGMSTRKTAERGYRQAFFHDTEIASPGYYAVTLEDTTTRVELTASAHAAHHRYTFSDRAAAPTVIIDVGHGLGAAASLECEVQIDGDEVHGRMLSAGRFTGANRAFDVYFSARLSPPPSSFGTWGASTLTEGGVSASGERCGAYFGFDAVAPVVEVRVGLSFIDVHAARANRGEVDALRFETVHARARQAWRSALSTVDVEGGSDADRTIFETALYHAMLMPTLMSEVQGRYVGLDRAVHQSAGFAYYSDLSMWDTYRTLHPLLVLIAPERQRDIALSLLAMAQQHGALPRWPLAVNETGVMIGSPASIILADSILKGVPGIDATAAYAAIRADAEMEQGRTIRGGFQHCTSVGWCPADRMGGSVSKSVEFAWADFAAANLAAQLGHVEDAARYRTRARGWAGHWDPSTAFLRGRNGDGTWSDEPFDPTALSEDFTEGNAWHYLFSPFFDVAHLAELFGGVDAMLDKLDAFFERSVQTPTPLIGGEPFKGPDLYYWHGNEPDIHAAFVYAAAGQAQRGQRWVDWVRQTKYGADPDGLGGNDDAGTLSAWLALTALGLYPIAGSDQYVIVAPLFERAVVHLPGGDLVIEAPGAPARRRVESISVDGVTHAEATIRHRALAGATIRFVLSD